VYSQQVHRYSLIQTGDYKERLSQQSFHDTEPSRTQRFTRHGLPRPTIPICCVALIAFLSMEVGVDPRTLGSVVLLGRFVRQRPTALGVSP
jgi:hypothetical protein